MTDIAIVDYGMGNLRSVHKALEHVAPTASVVVTSDPAVVRQAKRVVVPGQGAMPNCMHELEIRGFYVPLDEALSRVVIDLSGRPGLVVNIDFVRARIGDFDVDLVNEFFQGFVNHALVTLHVDNLCGKNAHHQAETVFKAFGRALRMALENDPGASGIIPSTKGTL